MFAVVFVSTASKQNKVVVIKYQHNNPWPLLVMNNQIFVTVISTIDQYS